MVIEVGKKAPDFKLDNQNGNVIKLGELRGKKVLLSMHPLAWTDICAKQMQSLENNFDKFESLNTIPFGFSIDHAPSKEAWAKELGISKVGLLCDFWPHGGVAKEYGLFREIEGFTERANVIIDEDGNVAWSKVYEMGQLPDIDEVLGVLEGM